MLLASTIVPCALSQEVGRMRPGSDTLRLGASADWELLRNDSTSQGTDATFNSLRQKYSLDLAGVIWDERFNRFALGLDFYRTDQQADGVKLGSQTLGYRADTTFFAGRPFPLRLYARRMATDMSGASLASSDRETSAYGAEWNLSLEKLKTFRVLYDHSTYDLLSPITLQEERNTGQVEFGQQIRRSELGLQYDYQDEKERVHDSQFARHELTLNDRTVFDSGATWLINTHYTLSDARYSTGETDDLKVHRLMTVLDLPQKSRLAWNFSYDHGRTDGKFLQATNNDLRAQSRIALNAHWEANATAGLGNIQSSTEDTDVQQELLGASAGVRYTQEWTIFRLGAGVGVGYMKSRFSTGPDVGLINHSADLDTRLSVGRRAAFFSSASLRKDKNDTSGLGFTLDEVRASAGFEGDAGRSLKYRGSVFWRTSTYDTFQFGVQESDEIGVEGSMTHPEGGVSLSLTRIDGISDFVPDPGAGTPFSPGNDLVRKSDVAALGARWRLPRRFQVRATARWERREFVSIGREEVLSFDPQVDWDFRVWHVTFGYTVYERTNSTSFLSNTWLLRAGWRFR